MFTCQNESRRVVIVCPNQEGTCEITGANIYANAILLKTYANIASRHIKSIDRTVNILLARLGFQPVVNGNITGNNVTVNCQSETRNLVCEIFEKAKGNTCSIMELTNILEKLPDSFEVINSLLALQEFTANMKIRAKLFLGFFLVLTITVVIAVFGIVNINTINDNYRLMQDYPSARYDTLNYLTTDIMDLRRIVTAMAFRLGDEPALNELRAEALRAL